RVGGKHHLRTRITIGRWSTLAINLARLFDKSFMSSLNFRRKSAASEITARWSHGKWRERATLCADLWLQGINSASFQNTELESETYLENATLLRRGKPWNRSSMSKNRRTYPCCSTILGTDTNELVAPLGWLSGCEIDRWRLFQSQPISMSCMR